ncbi:hypothetical protein BOX37_12345 [Nocardia mangyaensis]|uniref:Uncharacterized protein n=1 Tax=Nocardia mangyaensis TaxID=2213200 RepID=A0A1J0VRD9_9NOCA|nr:hypothetical protein [Nocardia mangyaensis]APE34616.1 hypothetical protein BOX37_12345 [Nocardia mangyaensis]
MLVTALVLAIAGVIRRALRRATTDDADVVTPRASFGDQLERVLAAILRAARRLVREPAPALSVAVAATGLALAGTHLVCSGLA